MKKLLILAALMLFPLTTWASMNTPKDDRGATLPTIDYVGALPCIINTGNNSILTQGPIVCGASSTTITRAVVYGVIASSLPVTAYLVFRDTVPLASNNGINGITAATAAVVYNITAYASTTTAAYTNMIKFPVPLQFQKGIAVNVDAALGGAQQSWTILYRPLNKNSNE